MLSSTIAYALAIGVPSAVVIAWLIFELIVKLRTLALEIEANKAAWASTKPAFEHYSARLADCEKRLITLETDVRASTNAALAAEVAALADAVEIDRASYRKQFGSVWGTLTAAGIRKPQNGTASQQIAPLPGSITR